MEYRPFDFENPEIPSVPESAPDATIVMGGSLETDTAIHDAVVGEVPTEDQREIDVAYHAAQLLVVERKAGKTAATMERMDRKDRFYLHIGRPLVRKVTSVKNPDYEEPAIVEPDGSTPRHRTWAERFMERRLDEKADKRAVAKSERTRIEKNYGGSATKIVGFKMAGATQLRLRQAEVEYKAGRMSPAELRTEKLMIKGSLGQSTEREKQRDLDKRLSSAEGEYRAGRITATELAAEQSEIKENPSKMTYRELVRAGLTDDDKDIQPTNFRSENLVQKRTRRQVKGAEKKVKRAAGQPIAERWRTKRYNKANKNFNENMTAADMHREALRRLDPDHPLLAYDDPEDDIIDPAGTPTVVAVPLHNPSRDYSDLVGEPTPEDSYETEPTTKELKEIALKYTADTFEKFGNGATMSPESIAKEFLRQFGLNENDPEEVEAAEDAAFYIFRWMQDQRVVSPRVLVQGGATGRQIMMSAEEIASISTEDEDED